MKTTLISILTLLSVSLASALESGKYLISCSEEGGRVHRGYILEVDDKGKPHVRVATSLESKGDTPKVTDTHLIQGSKPGMFILTVRFEERTMTGGTNGTPSKETFILTLAFKNYIGSGCEVSMTKDYAGSTGLNATVGGYPK